MSQYLHWRLMTMQIVVAVATYVLGSGRLVLSYYISGHHCDYPLYSLQACEERKQ